MSVLSFKTYCIENYAEYKNLSSSKVFENFVKSKLLNHLESDYDDLHGMGKEFLMDYFDKWFGKKDTHHLVKTLLIPQVAELLMKNKNMSEDDALKTIYTSPIAPLLEDDSMGLYGQSALYIYGLIAGED
ncbi:MAG: DUF3791 domain-containing protein [Treponema sp.]|nr:DUF3791 domain-containing protein [Treponema sp.]